MTKISLKCIVPALGVSSRLYRNYSYKAVRRPDSTILARKLTAPQVEAKTEESQAPNDLTKHLKAKILATGPITVAEYMREVLTNPLSGYYMHRDVFGREGDFITSPEICQIFGELVAIWVVSEWRKLGSPLPLQIVELGPGRGTLARDVLKVLTKFKFGGQFSMHMVEISPHLSKVQGQRLCFSTETVTDENSPHYQTGKTATGTRVYWHKRLEDVPRAFSIVLAHEFFDALPVHKLQRDGKLWKEVLIDVISRDSVDSDNQPDFRYVISKAQTPVSHLYQPITNETRDCLEYSLDTDRIISMMAERFEIDGGIGLIMDYGHFGEKGDTFRAFKKHKLHEPLLAPGTADLTADVDFRQIKRIAEEHGKVICFGPVEQGTFLKKMEGDTRLEQLLANALPENHDIIRSGYKMLTDPTQMGKRFKFFSIFPAVVRKHLEKFPVSGFQ
ncbi:PREDICTED: NADH dehydrogenase [ubiquinone] complex I, assembly factor 7 homolog [Rhagoletis zephyria]|uniref:NADH dehydrogenase [ubiquinone] complex I, assembly factor 7 homolog n=1 Tax=Rhagoletis zephyria TaxID=28612 RepID=UPI00081154F6|nr:PREDICTED: NADH dehydrogenase [ubiquinone] complex I, assembly factor 7 homolog [Rhagoletis zephyria]